MEMSVNEILNNRTLSTPRERLRSAKELDTAHNQEEEREETGTSLAVTTAAAAMAAAMAGLTHESVVATPVDTVVEGGCDATLLQPSVNAAAAVSSSSSSSSSSSEIGAAIIAGDVGGAIAGSGGCDNVLLGDISRLAEAAPMHDFTTCGETSDILAEMNATISGLGEWQEERRRKMEALVKQYGDEEGKDAVALEEDNEEGLGAALNGNTDAMMQLLDAQLSQWQTVSGGGGDGGGGGRNAKQRLLEHKAEFDLAKSKGEDNDNILQLLRSPTAAEPASLEPAADSGDFDGDGSGSGAAGTLDERLQRDLRELQLREIIAEARADAKQETDTKLSQHLEWSAQQGSDMFELEGQLKGYSSELDSIFSRFDVLDGQKGETEADTVAAAVAATTARTDVLDDDVSNTTLPP